MYERVLVQQARPLNSGRLERVQLLGLGAPERDLRRCDSLRVIRETCSEAILVDRVRKARAVRQRGRGLLESSARRGQQRWEAKTCATMNHESAVQPEDRSGGAGYFADGLHNTYTYCLVIDPDTAILERLSIRRASQASNISCCTVSIRPSHATMPGSALRRSRSNSC